MVDERPAAQDPPVGHESALLPVWFLPTLFAAICLAVAVFLGAIIAGGTNSGRSAIPSPAASAPTDASDTSAYTSPDEQAYFTVLSDYLPPSRIDGHRADWVAVGQWACEQKAALGPDYGRSWSTTVYLADQHFGSRPFYDHDGQGVVQAAWKGLCPSSS